MGKIKHTIKVLLLVLMLSESQAQDIAPGLIRAQLTLSPSYSFSDKQSYFYLHGNLEGFLEKNISLAGEAYFSLGNVSSNPSVYDFNHSIFFGSNIHFTKNNNDIYLGLQPGLAFTRLDAVENSLTSTTIGTNPLFSTVAGYNFYLNRLFHFFIQSRLVIGKHNYDVSKSLSEFRFSGGLGFNINAIKSESIN